MLIFSTYCSSNVPVISATLKLNVSWKKIFPELLTAVCVASSNAICTFRISVPSSLLSSSKVMPNSNKGLVSMFSVRRSPHPLSVKSFEPVDRIVSTEQMYHANLLLANWVYRLWKACWNTVRIPLHLNTPHDMHLWLTDCLGTTTVNTSDLHAKWFRCWSRLPECISFNIQRNFNSLQWVSFTHIKQSSCKAVNWGRDKHIITQKPYTNWSGSPSTPPVHSLYSIKKAPTLLF